MARPKAGARDGQKQQYGIWLGIPVSARKCDEKTQVEICKKIGITEKTAKEWRKDPMVQSIAENALKILGGNDIMEVINTMTIMAKKQDSHCFYDRKLFLEWQGQLGNKSGGKNPVNFSVDYVTDDRT